MSRKLVTCFIFVLAVLAGFLTLQPRFVTAHSAPMTQVVFSRDGQIVLTASEDGLARLWSASGALWHTLEGHTDKVGSAAYSPDGTRVATASSDQTAILWDAHSGVMLRS